MSVDSVLTELKQIKLYYGTANMGSPSSFLGGREHLKVIRVVSKQWDQNEEL